MSDELDNYIIYIDEIDSFLKTVTHNDTLNHKLKPIYAQLCKMIKNAHKVIVSDAVIRLPTVCSFLHKRTNYIYVENGYKKYKDIKATRVRDEENFINLIVERIQTNNYFWFGCDSCDTVTKIYNECMRRIEDQELKQNENNNG